MAISLPSSRIPNTHVEIVQVSHCRKTENTLSQKNVALSDTEQRGKNRKNMQWLNSKKIPKTNSWPWG